MIGGWVCADRAVKVSGAVPSDERGEPASESSRSAPIDTAPEEPSDCAERPGGDLPPPGLQPTGTGELLIEGKAHALDGAIRVENPFGEDASRRGGTRLVLHDGEARVWGRARPDGGTRTDYAVYGARASLSLTLYPAGGELVDRSFELVPGADPDEPAFADDDVAVDARLAVDLDGDGAVSSGELLALSGGKIALSGERDAFSLRLTLSLEDGGPVEGAYEGGTVLID